MPDSIVDQNLVNFYYGALFYKKTYLADHDHKGGMSKHLAKVNMPLPLNRDSIVNEANKVLLASANRVQYSDEYHFLLHETLDTAISHPCKPGHEKYLPICLPVECAFLINEPMRKSLNIVIVRKDLMETKGSYDGGSHGNDSDDAKVDRAIETFASGLTMAYMTKKPPTYMHGLSPVQGMSREKMLEVFKTLGKCM